jgi:membrane protein implicated in regulation of membrane protease activity
MVMLIVGILVVVLHVIVIGTIILWFGLGNPTSMEQFRVRLKDQFLGSRRPK